MYKNTQYKLKKEWFCVVFNECCVFTNTSHGS